VPDIKAETLFTVIKDILLRCNLSLQLCRGQAYDGVANMQGKMSGVATRFKMECPCYSCNSLLCSFLEFVPPDIGRKLICLRDALDTVKEITNLICFSPKRTTLFYASLLQQPSAPESAAKALTIMSNMLDSTYRCCECYHQGLWHFTRSFRKNPANHT
jgi:hypothetical protein